MDDALRLNAAAVAVQVFIGGEHETQSVRNMTRLVDAGQRYGIPVLAVTAVGNVVNLASRLCAHAEKGQILVDPKVEFLVKAAIQLEPVGEFLPKGFSRPVSASNAKGLLDGF